ncbi:peroxiredoxin [Pseudochelatococcus sp. B33]
MIRGDDPVSDRAAQAACFEFWVNWRSVQKSRNHFSSTKLRKCKNAWRSSKGFHSDQSRMVEMNNLHEVDWSRIPPPKDDGGAAHLRGAAVPGVPLIATDGTTINLAELEGLAVVYAYPRTGQPGVPLPEEWDMIPGARGCTPQSCAFRDHFDELRDLGVEHLFGLSTQETAYQQEAAERLHLPFPLLSDETLSFARALGLPTFEVEGMTLLKRLTLVIDRGRVEKVFYPIFPPDRNAGDVIAWLGARKL